MRFTLLLPTPGHPLINLRGGCSVSDWSVGGFQTRYYTQHCFHLRLQSRVPALSLTSSKTRGPVQLLKLSAAPKPAWFPTLTPPPFQFIFCNSRRLLGFHTVTLMRRASGRFPPSGTNLFSPFNTLMLTESSVPKPHTVEEVEYHAWDHYSR